MGWQAVCAYDGVVPLYALVKGEGENVYVEPYVWG